MIVEAALTESCNPVITWQALYIFSDYMIKLQACQRNPSPKLLPALPSGVTIRLADFARIFSSLRTITFRGDGVIAWRMAKKPFQQGRSERKSEASFSEIEDWNGWNDEIQQGVQNGFTARPQPMEAPEA